MLDDSTVKANGSLDPCTVVGAAVEAFNARRLDRLLALLRPDAEIRPLRPAGQEVYRGRAEVELLLAELARDRRDQRIVIEHTRLAGNRVIAIGHIQAGRERILFAGFHELRDGLIARMHHYFSDEPLLRQIGRIG